MRLLLICIVIKIKGKFVQQIDEESDETFAQTITVERGDTVRLTCRVVIIDDDIRNASWLFRSYNHYDLELNYGCEETFSPAFRDYLALCNLLIRNFSVNNVGAYTCKTLYKNGKIQDLKYVTIGMTTSDKEIEIRRKEKHAKVIVTYTVYGYFMNTNAVIRCYTQDGIHFDINSFDPIKKNYDNGTIRVRTMFDIKYNMWAPGGVRHFIPILKMEYLYSNIPNFYTIDNTRKGDIRSKALTIYPTNYKPRLLSDIINFKQTKINGVTITTIEFVCIGISLSEDASIWMEDERNFIDGTRMRLALNMR